MNLSLGLSLSNRVVPSEPVEELGPELVVNGGFDTTDDWSGVQWSIAAGTADAATAGFARTFANTGGTPSEAGKTYRCTFTITSISAGSVLVQYSVLGTARTTPGTYTEDLVADGAGSPVLRATANTTASVDNVSIKEVLAP